MFPMNADKMYNPNDDAIITYPIVDYNKKLKLNKPTNRISLKVPKVDKPLNKKTLSLNFGYYFNKQPNVHSIPDFPSAKK